MEFGPVIVRPPTGSRPRRGVRVVALGVALAVVLLAIGAIAWPVWRRTVARRGDAAGAPITQRPSRVVPDSVRIKVEVVNATATRGLARLTTQWLRDKGFDVVSTTTAAEKDRRDSSLVLDRSGHPDWAALAAASIGGARVEARPDSSHYLDLTILVGRSWRAPPQALYP